MRRISFSRGKGKIGHNNRTFISPNVDKDRVADNIILKQQNLSEAYDEIFGEATEKFNAKQKRNDRKINSYYEKIFEKKPTDTIVKNDNGQHNFYEYVVGVGNKNDTGFEANPEAAKVAVECLKEYMNGFENRNPQFHVFNAVIHCDEATPHVHYDFIPYADGYKKGLERQNGISKALEQMGYGKGEQAYKNFTQSERNIFREICEAHGIEIAPEEESRGYTYSTAAYREYGAKLEEIKQELPVLVEQRDTLYDELDELSERKYYLEKEVKELDDYANKVYEEINTAEMYRSEKINKRFFETNEDYVNRYRDLHGMEYEKTNVEERLNAIKKKGSIER